MIAKRLQATQLMIDLPDFRQENKAPHSHPGGLLPTLAVGVVSPWGVPTITLSRIEMERGAL